MRFHILAAVPSLPFALVPLLVALLCGLAYRQRPGRTVRLLGLGAVAAAIGLPCSILASGLPGTTLRLIDIGGVPFDLLAAGLFWQATACIFGSRPSPWWLGAAPVAWLAAACVLPISGSLAPRHLEAAPGLALGCVLTLLALLVLLRPPREVASHRGLVVLAGLHLLYLVLLCVLTVAGALPGLRAMVASFLPMEILGYVVLWPGLGMLLIAENAFMSEYRRALQDELSGILNRRGFWRAAEPIRHRSLLLFDIDHFKRINDTFGHAAGDAVITRFTRLAATILGERTVFGRIGGEEFAAALDDATIADARRVAERVRIAFADVEQTIGATTTVSVGVSVASREQQPLGDQMALADRALYRAKRLGRNRVVLYGSSEGDALPLPRTDADRQMAGSSPGTPRRRALRDAR